MEKENNKTFLRHSELACAELVSVFQSLNILVEMRSRNEFGMTFEASFVKRY